MVNRLELVEAVAKVFHSREGHLVTQIHSQVILGYIILEVTLQVEERFLISKVFQLLCTVSGLGLLVVTENLRVKFVGHCFLEVVLGHELTEQIVDLLIEVELENLLDHHR